MNQIKFRAWDKDSKKMFKIARFDFSDYTIYSHLFACDGYLGESCEIMQYTGLKDKNGVEIFESDILKCTSKIYTNLGATRTGEYEETIKQVIWKDDSWGTRVISSNLTSKGAEKSGLVISAKYAEVIGNIYENKGLLEELN